MAQNGETSGAREGKLIQYLVEAYGKERELETSLQAHIGMTDRRPYKKRLQEHLRETKSHARLVERRIKQLGGGGTLTSAVKEGTALTKRATALAKGPLHMVRGTSDEEKLLKNAKTEYSEEHEEIATYTAIETLATALSDTETAKLARQIRREEERMASFLARQIPVLTKAVVTAEIPAAERNGTGRSPRRRSGAKRKSSSAAGSSSRGSSSKRGAASKRSSSSKRSSTSKRASSSKRGTTARAGSAKRTTAAKRGTARKSGSSSRKTGSSSRARAGSRS